MWFNVRVKIFFRNFDEKKVIWKFSYNNIIEGVKTMAIKLEDDEEILYLNLKRCTSGALIVSKKADTVCQNKLKLLWGINISK